MDIAGAADRRRVVQHGGGGVADRPDPQGLVPDEGRPCRLEGGDAAAPGPEHLGAGADAGNLRQIGVEPPGLDPAGLARLVAPGKQLPSRDLGEFVQRLEQRPVPQLVFLDRAALAAKAQSHDPVLGQLDMVLQQCRGAIGAVFLRVAALADPDPRLVDERDHRRQQRFGAGKLPLEILADAAPDARQRPAELPETVVFERPALLFPVRMVAVLLAVAVVQPGRLQVAFRIETDPDLAPGRRHRQCGDAIQRLRVPDGRAVRQGVGKTAPAPAAPDARLLVADICEGAHRAFPRWPIGRCRHENDNAGAPARFRTDLFRPAIPPPGG